MVDDLRPRGKRSCVYSPQFGSARIPSTLPGMIAGGVLRGDMPIRPWIVPEGFPPRRARARELAVEQAPGRSTSRWASSGGLGEAPADRGDPGHLPLRPAAYYAQRMLLTERFKCANTLRGHAVTLSRSDPGALMKRRIFVATDHPGRRNHVPRENQE